MVGVQDHYPLLDPGVDLRALRAYHPQAALACRRTKISSQPSSPSHVKSNAYWGQGRRCAARLENPARSFGPDIPRMGISLVHQRKKKQKRFRKRIYKEL